MKLRNLLVKFINLYQKYLSPLKKGSCVFYPTCSEYTKSAVIKYGSVKGVYLGFKRVIRCHPWQHNHMDPLR